MNIFIYTAFLGCLCLTSAALVVFPLILFSPVILWSAGPIMLARTWGVWFTIIIHGLDYLLGCGVLLYRCTYRRIEQLPAHLAERRVQQAALEAIVPSVTSNASTQTSPPRRTILTPRTLSTPRPTSDAPFVPQQMPTSPRESAQDPQYMASTFASHIRDSDKDYAYSLNMSPDGASRLSSRRPSRAGSIADLNGLAATSTPRVISSENATPRVVRSRAGSFNFGAMPESVTNGGTESHKDSKRHKRTHTDG